MGKIDRLLELVLTFALVGLTGCSSLPAGPQDGRSEARKVISLDGTWEIAEGAMDSMPTEFGARVPVPGLVDMAEPAFAASSAARKALAPPRSEWEKSAVTISVRRSAAAATMLAACFSRYGEVVEAK